MQIHKIDIASSGDTPRSPKMAGPSSANVNRELSLVTSRELEAEGVTEGSELDRLTRQLDGISDVRADVVAAARVKVLQGDYLTTAVAERTAAAILSKDV